ncbi:Phosphatidylinositol 4-phosphate 5-kinase its3 [Phytophthora nicotianae]|uniref:Phosphatidylinositol 4-phosphate 5-kinase its3 n=1 Tax=Phytophthora nicotianae TaxID=4792 RepID=A0A0W8CWW6_PHYNI|nr:Phosphatidylinositol 4-phosphate 5-kinase its3 [Phytophthora nicotianae]
MVARPATGQRKANAAAQQPLQGKLRPQSAAQLAIVPESPPRNVPGAVNGERVGATSDELIRDLEHKVRKVVELKRAKSDKLRFEVAKKREEVEKAKLVLQDLIKDKRRRWTQLNGDKIVEEPNRLQPIASISRRPVYSKHTKINELEAKLEKRAQASHEVLRSTMVLEHIKKRLLNERIEVTQETNELKARFADLNHQTQELQKKEISASEAVSQIQARLVEQKVEMATNLRKYKREVEMRQKWAREKAKFEKYYNDQMQTSHFCYGAGSPNKMRSVHITTSDEMDPQEEYRQAFLRMGFGHYSEGVDPEEIIRTWLSHEEIMKELGAKHDEDMERIAVLRDQLAKSRNIANEKVPLSKRGTSQRLEVKEIEISSVERALATVVDQYMFVDQSVRPLKIGLQQILQNVTNETVNVDDMAGIENALMGSIEEMMKLVRETRLDSDSPSNQSSIDEALTSGEATPVGGEGESSNASKAIAELGVVSADHFTSPFNIRIPPKPKEPYYVLGVSTVPPAAKAPDDGKGKTTSFSCPMVLSCLIQDTCIRRARRFGRLGLRCHGPIDG